MNVAVDDRMSFSSVGRRFHSRGAATENARSPIRRSVLGWKRSPLLEVRRALHTTYGAVERRTATRSDRTRVKLCSVHTTHGVVRRRFDVIAEVEPCSISAAFLPYSAVKVKVKVWILAIVPLT